MYGDNQSYRLSAQVMPVLHILHMSKNAFFVSALPLIPNLANQKTCIAERRNHHLSKRYQRENHHLPDLYSPE